MILKEYFKDSELSCKCGCGLMPDTKSIEMLYALRLLITVPLKINSGARCEKHNNSVGGVPGSAHLIGAFDVAVPKDYRWRFLELSQFAGFTGIGISPKFIHIDRHHSAPKVWTY